MLYIKNTANRCCDCRLGLGPTITGSFYRWAKAQPTLFIETAVMSDQMLQQSLILSQVSFDYPNKELSGVQPLLHEVSFTLNAGQILHIQGPNGSGKTSLLKLLAGLLRADEGVITYSGADIWSNIADYQQNLNYLGHKNGLHPNLTVWEQACENQPINAKEKVMQSLHDFDLWVVRDKFCATLSAGQKRRLALLRLFLSPAKLWLLDEPLTALDAQGRTCLMTYLQAHIGVQGQIIYTSHQALPWHGF